MNKDQAVHAYYEVYDELIYEMYQDWMGGVTKQKWNISPFHEIRRLWVEYARYGFVRSEKLMEKVIDRFIETTARLQLNTELCGHSPLKPLHIFEVHVPDEGDWPEGTEESLEAWTDKYCWSQENGQWLISDYGLPTLNEILLEMMVADTYEEKLGCMDRMLQVTHPRFDLAMLYIQGGSKSLTKLFEFSVPV